MKQQEVSKKKKKKEKLLTAAKLKALGKKMNLKVKLFESLRVAQEEVWVRCKVLRIHRDPFNRTVFSL